MHWNNLHKRLKEILSLTRRKSNRNGSCSRSSGEAEKLRTTGTAQSDCNRAIVDVAVVSDPDLYQYTSGYWVCKDQEQRSARYVKFNFEALCTLATQSIGANTVVKFTKIRTGCFCWNSILVLKR